MKAFTIFSMFVWLTSTLSGQSLLSAAGHSYESQNAILEWSLGELQTQTYSSGQVVLSLGFHQITRKSNVVVSNPEAEHTLLIYPNPADQYVTAVVPNRQIRQVTLFSSDGRIVFESHPGSSECQIQVSHLPPGWYGIRVKTDGQDQPRKASLIIR